MAANYGRPKPVDTVRERAFWWLSATCPCGRRRSTMICDLADRLRLPPETRLWEITERLRCSACGNRSPSIDVRQTPLGA